jgi:hypothetical protein
MLTQEYKGSNGKMIEKDKKLRTLNSNYERGKI